MIEVKETDYLPDLAPAGLALLVIFGLLMWYDLPSDTVRPFDPYPQHQNPHVTEHAYESWLWQDPFGFKPDQKNPPTVPSHCQLGIKIHRIINEEKKDVKILAPLLKVRRDNIENKELRTRHRYAVIAGLIESGYRPSDPDRLHFCSSQENSSNAEYDMRWEHYHHESNYKSDKDKSDKDKTDRSDNKPDIIVVWMNSEIFTDKKMFNFPSQGLNHRL